MTAATSPVPTPAFDAVLYPSRSLPPVGFAVLMTLVVLVSALVGAGFVMVGAWPVTGFLGLDVLLLYLAFRWNYRESRRVELIRLDQEGLTVRKVEPDGRAREWRFEPYWVRVAFERPGDGRSRLYLTSHGQWLQIGGFLSAEERVDVANALRAALHAQRAQG